MFFVTLFTFSISDFLLAQANLFQTFSSTFFHFFSTIDFTFLDSPTRKELNVTWICLRATEQPVTYTLDRFMNDRFPEKGMQLNGAVQPRATPQDWLGLES